MYHHYDNDNVLARSDRWVNSCDMALAVLPFLKSYFVNKPVTGSRRLLFYPENFLEFINVSHVNMECFGRNPNLFQRAKTCYFAISYNIL